MPDVPCVQMSASIARITLSHRCGPEQHALYSYLSLVHLQAAMQGTCSCTIRLDCGQCHSRELLQRNALQHQCIRMQKADLAACKGALVQHHKVIRACQENSSPVYCMTESDNHQSNAAVQGSCSCTIPIGLRPAPQRRVHAEEGSAAQLHQAATTEADCLGRSASAAYESAPRLSGTGVLLPTWRRLAQLLALLNHQVPKPAQPVLSGILDLH